MKKADAIRTVIEEIKAQNRSSLNADDFEAFKKRYSGRFTTGLAMDLQAEAAKAGIKPPEDFSLEDMLPKRRATAAERKAGVGPGKQLRTNVTDLPEAEIKKVGVITPITVDDDGAKMLLKNIQRTDGTVQSALYDLTKTADRYLTHLTKTEGKNSADQFVGKLNKMFPDGILDIEKRISEHRVYEQLLFEAGYLEDADPSTGKEERKGKTLFTFKDLDAEFDALPETQKGRQSREGKRILDIKEKGGVPAVVGRDKNGKLIYHPTKTIPHKLKLSKKGIDYVKDFRLPAYVSTRLPAIVESAKPVEEQQRDRRREYYKNLQGPTGDEPSLANPVTSERTGKTYDNYNQMVAAEGRPESTRTGEFLKSLEETDKSGQLELPFSKRSLSDEQKAKRTSNFLKFIESGGRRGLKVLIPVVGAGITFVEEVLASKPLNPYRTSEEQEYDRMMERAKREELIPRKSEVRGRTMEEVKSKTPTSFYNQ